MTANEYKAMIEASGGFTSRKARGVGDRPQPLTTTDEIALNEAWKEVSKIAESKSAKSLQDAEPVQEKRSA